MLDVLHPLSMKSLLAACCILAMPAVALPAGNVLVVDGGGSSPYTTIQAAVDAALDGDVLVVQGGAYATFVITDKSLTVVADFGADVSINGGVTVRDLAATRTVVLANLNVEGLHNAPVALSNGMTVANNAGHVRIEGCTVLGAYGLSGWGVDVTSSSDVAFVACEVRGGQRASGSCYVSGGPGLSATFGSGVTAYGSTFRGNHGSQGSCMCSGGYGGDACRVSQSTLFASSSTFLGGDGGHCGHGSLFAAPFGGDGGAGILAGVATVRLLDSVTNGGAAGRAILNVCGDYGFDGADGADRYNFNSTYTDIPGESRTLSMANPVHAGTTAFLTARGQPGDVVGVLFGDTTPTATYKPAWRGMLLVPLRAQPQGQRFLLLGTVPANGVLNYPLAIPALGPGQATRATFLQALFVDPQGQRTLSGVRSVTVLP